MTYAAYNSCFCAHVTADLDGISYTKPHTFNLYTKFYFRTIIRSWVTDDSIWWAFQYPTCNGRCACAVSRDLCIGGPPNQRVTIFRPRIVCWLCNIYGATTTIKGPQLYRACQRLVKGFQRGEGSNFGLSIYLLRCRHNSRTTVRVCDCLWPDLWRHQLLCLKLRYR